MYVRHANAVHLRKNQNFTSSHQAVTDRFTPQMPIKPRTLSTQLLFLTLVLTQCQATAIWTKTLHLCFMSPRGSNPTVSPPEYWCKQVNCVDSAFCKRLLPFEEGNSEPWLHAATKCPYVCHRLRTYSIHQVNEKQTFIWTKRTFEVEAKAELGLILKERVQASRSDNKEGIHWKKTDIFRWQNLNGWTAHNSSKYNT